MINDFGLLIGLISIALGLFLGLFFGLAGFRKDVTSELSSIKEAVIAIRTTVEKTWDIVVVRFGEGSGTVERELENLGKVKITAEPGAEKTTYLIEIEKPLLKEGLFLKEVKKPYFVKQEAQILGEEGKTTFSSPESWLELARRNLGKVIVLSPHRMRYSLPSTDPKVCTEFITFFLNWLNSTYIESLKEIKVFEESILT